MQAREEAWEAERVVQERAAEEQRKATAWSIPMGKHDGEFGDSTRRLFTDAATGMGGSRPTASAGASTPLPPGITIAAT